MRAGAQRRPGGRDQSRHRAGGKAGDGAVDRPRASRPRGDEVTLIPGCVEDVNLRCAIAYLRSGPSDHPGMTPMNRHCEERSDEAIPSVLPLWIVLRSL